MLFFDKSSPLRVALVGSLSLLTACSELTQLIVVIDSDLVPPTELAQVAVQVLARDGREASHVERINLAADSLPLSFGITPPLDDPKLQVSIAFEAHAPDDHLFTTHATTSFVAGKTLLLPIQLLASCGELLPCPSPNHTCREGRCASSEYDPAMLVETKPGREFEDSERPPPRGDSGGAADAGVDRDGGTNLDAAVRDAGAADAGGGPNPSCTLAADCDLPGKCPPDAQDCSCRATPMGMNCVPICSASNTSCPAGANLQCDVGAGLCTPR